MIVLVAKYTVKPGRGDEVAAALQRMVAQVKANEPGCKLFHACRSNDDPNFFLLYELYEDQAALEAHREMPHFKQIVEGTIIPMLDQRVREFYTLVAS
jgi:quinol monooxygenase YgiN